MRDHAKDQETEPKAHSDLRIRKTPSGGWIVERLDPGSFRNELPAIAAFTNAQDMLEALPGLIGAEVPTRVEPGCANSASAPAEEAASCAPKGDDKRSPNAGVLADVEALARFRDMMESLGKAPPIFKWAQFPVTGGLVNEATAPEHPHPEPVAAKSNDEMLEEIKHNAIEAAARIMDSPSAHSRAHDVEEQLDIAVRAARLRIGIIT